MAHLQISPVFEIKVLYCAHTGCKGCQNRVPGILFTCSPYISFLHPEEDFKKLKHVGITPIKV